MKGSEHIRALRNSRTLISRFVFVFLSVSLVPALSFGFGTNLIDNDSTFHVTYVRLNLSVRPDSNALAGSVLLRCVARDIAANRQILFSLRDKHVVDAVLINGDTAPFLHNEDSVLVTLADRYIAGTVFDVAIFYHSVPDYGTDDWGDPVHTVEIWDSATAATYPELQHPISWTASEPFNAKFWWPCKDNPADKIDSADLYITCDTPFDIASNGILQAVIDHGSTRTFWWHESYPIDHYLIAWVCTVFDTLSHNHRFADGTTMPVTNYVFPISVDTMRSRLVEIDTILDLYERWYGPYPFRREKYGFAQWNGGGMENETLSFCYSADSGLVAHETAHQWFGDGITCKSWNDAWLNEGFAVYTTDLYFEHCDGETFFDTIVSQQEQQVSTEPSGSVHIPDSLLATRSFDIAMVYCKGGLLLNMLRFVLGSDSTFFRCLREYATGPLRYGVAGPDDFAASVSHSIGTDMSWFFNEWIYGAGYPIYSISWDDHDMLHPSVAISQTGSSESSPFFTMPIELEFKGPAIDTVVRVWNDAPLQSYSFTVTGPVSTMIFDPHNRLVDGMLPRVLAVTPANAPGSTIAVVPELNGYSFEFSIAEPQEVRFEICDLLGRTVASISEGMQSTGFHSIPWEPSGLTSGAYFCRMIGGKTELTTRFILSN